MCWQLDAPAPTHDSTGQPCADRHAPQHASVFDSGDLTTEIERCKCEIATVEEALLSGHPDVSGLCLALTDWSAELRILQAQQSQHAARRDQ